MTGQNYGVIAKAYVVYRIKGKFDHNMNIVFIFEISKLLDARVQKVGETSVKSKNLVCEIILNRLSI